MKTLLLALIRFYQKYLSLDQGYPRKIFFPNADFSVCRFTPTCSEYMYQSIEKYGILIGVLKGTYRIIRCNPFSAGGHDPVK